MHLLNCLRQVRILQLTFLVFYEALRRNKGNLSLHLINLIVVIDWDLLMDRLLQLRLAHLLKHLVCKGFVLLFARSGTFGVSRMRGVILFRITESGAYTRPVRIAIGNNYRILRQVLLCLCIRLSLHSGNTASLLFLLLHVRIDHLNFVVQDLVQLLLLLSFLHLYRVTRSLSIGVWPSRGHHFILSGHDVRHLDCIGLAESRRIDPDVVQVHVWSRDSVLFSLRVRVRLHYSI